MKLLHLDGLRAIVAIYVVLFHIWMDVQGEFKASESELSIFLGKVIEKFVSHGTSSVAVFIVLSGYCLTLRIAKSPNLDVTGGIPQFFKRRAFRILPTYYFALLFSVLVHIFVPEDLVPLMGTHWNIGTKDALSAGSVFSHSLLVHNIFPAYNGSINPPFWSVAWEWQLYFFLPFVFLPILKKLGSELMLISALILSVILFNRVPYSWYLILFSIGILSAIVSVSKNHPVAQKYKFLGWHYFGRSCIIIWVATTFLAYQIAFPKCMRDIVLALATSFLLIDFSKPRHKYLESRILSILRNKWLVFIGSFSYSLYLTHAIFLGLTQIALSSVEMPPFLNFVVLICTALPFSILGAFSFYLLFERPFIIKRMSEKGTKLGNEA